jgi:hypothetical protein
LLLLSGFVRPAPEPAAPVTRTEFFLLEQRTASSAAPAGARLIGTAVIRKRVDADGETLELEARFDELDTRVLHVESWSARGAKLVWREWRPGAGRTLVCERVAAGAPLEVVEWSRTGRTPRRTLAGDAVWWPLQLIEMLRTRETLAASLQRFDPLSGALERVAFEPCSSAANAAGVRLVGEDGVDLGCVEFADGELARLTWQSSALAARRVERNVFEAARPLTSEPALPTVLEQR